MMKYYHGAKKNGPYFEGWYFKHQAADGRMLALIPAIQMGSGGRSSASLQVISDQGTWWLEYSRGRFDAAENRFQIRLSKSVFGEDGVELDVDRPELQLHGKLRYGPLIPLRSPIMGPFQYLPMECSHGVISMGHTLEGTLVLNGESIPFSGGTGYVESDYGSSFPRAYLWTQCGWQQEGRNSLMLSVAHIPFLGGSFTGCICAVIYKGREYRLATYQGARVERWSAEGAAVRQGKYRLTAELLEQRGHPLRAPDQGNMSRTIYESVRAKLRYRFWDGEKLLFEHTDSGASFEYADERSCYAESAAI